MSRALTISAPAVSATTLAARLKVPKNRRDRIFAIVGTLQNGSSRPVKAAKKPSRRSLSSAAATLHSRQRKNSKNAKSSR
jgi:uncharacterized protein (DUF2249 family)